MDNKWLTIIIAAVVGLFAIVHYIFSSLKNIKDLGWDNIFKWETLLKIGKKLLIPLSVLAMLFGAYKFGQTRVSKQCKERIAILLPLNEENKSAYQDGIRQLLGFTELIKDNPDYTNDFEFVIYDHDMNKDNAENAIRKELRKGTKYFIVTMSKISKPISEKFQSLIEEEGVTGNKPVLISTVASSPKIKLQMNNSYRYYIRSQDESKELAIAISKNKAIKSVVAIAVHDDYGTGAIEEFQNNWKEGVFAKPILISPATKDLSGFIDIISSQKNEIDNSTAIFIAHYGNGIDNIIKALNELGIKRPIYATSTLSVKQWREPIKDILDKQEWYTCVPKYTSYDEGHKDIIKDFMRYALQRTILSANELKSNSSISFDDAWRQVKIPENLETKFESNGDIIIDMTTIDKTNNYLK